MTVPHHFVIPSGARNLAFFDTESLYLLPLHAQYTFKGKVPRRPRNDSAGGTFRLKCKHRMTAGGKPQLSKSGELSKS